MDFQEYQEQARRTQRKDLPLWATREHALYGLASEVGEVLGLFQKTHQGHPMDENALRLELGDVLWFVSELCDVNGWLLEDIAVANIQKLRNRYPHQFTPEQSMHRAEKPSKSRHYARSEGRK